MKKERALPPKMLLLNLAYKKRDNTLRIFCHQRWNSGGTTKSIHA